ncbi:MAG TPA: ChaN family lipoprotein [Chitinophagales bacterium]|nr:ChaN family lipoprotein [Chitinophagales bacterium]
MKYLIALCLLSTIAEAQITEQHYIVYNTRTQQVTTLDAIVQEMQQYDVLFFGEEHNDSVGHFLEAQLVEKMFAAYGAQSALSMEMFDRDVQEVMDEYLAGLIKEKQFVKDARTWSNYRDYRPMVEFAKTNHMPVVCANAAGRYSSLAVRKGMQGLMALPEASKSHIAPLPFDTASGPYFDKLVEVFTGHDSSMTAANVTATGMDMIMGQSTWDATMAWSIAEYLKAHKGHKVLQVNGRFHSDEHYAVVTQLHNYRPKARSLVISSGSDENFPNIDWSQHKQNGDYIIITDPKVPRTYEE